MEKEMEKKKLCLECKKKIEDADSYFELHNTILNKNVFMCSYKCMRTHLKDRVDDTITIDIS
jgi:hypothetical protein